MIWPKRKDRLPDDFGPLNMSAWPPPAPASEPGSMLEPAPEACASCGKCPRCGR